MSDFIALAGADVVALQEVGLASVEALAVDQPAFFADLTGLEVRYAAVSAYPLVEPDSRRVVGATLWGNVILSRHPIEAATTHALPVATDDDPTDPVDTEPRCALACEIATPDGRLTFMSTHLAYLGSRARRLQADRLAEIVDATGGPLVLAGDLNAAVERPELRALTTILDDGFASVGIPVGDARRESCGVDRIDHVLARGFQFTECQVAREAGDLSDHWPVIARLRFADPA